MTARWEAWGARALAALEGLAGLRLLRPLWLIAVLGLAGWYLVVHRAQIFAQPLAPSAIGAAFALTLAGKFFAALQVRVALTCCGEELALAPAFYAYSMSDVGKYIPGGIWSVVSRVGLYRALRLRARVIAQTLVIEQLWYIAAAALTGAMLYLAGRWNLRLAAIAAPLLLAALLWGMNRWMPVPLAPRALAKLLVVQLVQWLLLGAGFAALLNGAVPFPAAAGAFLIAFAAGMAVPFAPGGIGVREAVIGLLLLPFLNTPAIGYDVLVSRAVWIAADISFALLVTITCRGAWAAAVHIRNAAAP
jgi:hypothetical protein